MSTPFPHIPDNNPPLNPPLNPEQLMLYGKVMHSFAGAGTVHWQKHGNNRRLRGSIAAYAGILWEHKITLLLALDDELEAIDEEYARFRLQWIAAHPDCCTAKRPFKYLSSASHKYPKETQP